MLSSFEITNTTRIQKDINLKTVKLEDIMLSPFQFTNTTRIYKEDT